MSSKTPQFNKALDEYFLGLELDEKGGQWRTCRFSGEKFYVRPEDIDFYKKIQVPLPTLSPPERIRRKLAFWNSYNLYYGQSSFSGKRILMQYPPNTPYKIYEHQVWFGQEWNSLEYERDYDLDKRFFEQFKDLQLSVPRPNLFVDSTSVNSEYTNDSVHLKNCYLVFNAVESEECYYSISPLRSQYCFDCFDVFDSNICYDCFESHQLYQCFFVEYSKNCLESYFLYDCRNCTYCFGGINLRHKKYMFFNEQLTKEEYERRLQSINLGNQETLTFYKNKFEELTKKAIHKPNHNDRAVDSYGNYIISSRNCYACFFVEESENVAYSIGSLKSRDVYDSIVVESEFSYEVSGGVCGYKLQFVRNSENSREVEYSDLSFNCHNIFGCIGLSNKSFCIFNKQYTEEDYWKLLDMIKTQMLKDGEYGEFFSPDLSPFPYNISIATSYKGYDDLDTTQGYGYRTEEVEESLYDVVGEVVETKDLPVDIKNVSDDILKKIIYDSKNNKKFRYIKSELDFYKKYNLPLPQEHFSVRLAEKRKKFGTIVIELYERTCPRCGQKFQSSYAPDCPEIVYCEQCYQQEVV